MRTWLAVQGIGRATPADLEELQAIATDLSIDPDELATIIAIESAWNPASHNASRAGGLIGFLPSTLLQLGWTSTPEDFFNRSIAEQLPYVRRFFEHAKQAHPGSWSQGDAYLATFWPKAVGQNDLFVIASPDSDGFEHKVWEQNPGLRAGKEGPITAGSVRDLIKAVMNRASQRARHVPGAGPVGPIERHKDAAGGIGLGTVLLIGAGVWLWRKYRRR